MLFLLRLSAWVGGFVVMNNGLSLPVKIGCILFCGGGVFALLVALVLNVQVAL